MLSDRTAFYFFFPLISNLGMHNILFFLICKINC
uniref:Uncharacterized protein n=1 Tax=Anguilla anguilla TaxID=7936 RepID=A0A0E9VF09_ANGAN